MTTGPVEDKALHKWLTEKGSFPKGERPEPYQEYWWKGAWRPGQRSVRERAETIGFKPKKGETVLELGSQMGGFLQLALLNGARWVEGLEYDSDHVDASRRLLEPLTNDAQRGKIIQGDMTHQPTLEAIKARIPGGDLDHLLLLSLGKHIGGKETIRRLIKTFNAKRTYIETNAIKPGAECVYGQLIVGELGGKFMGLTTDRNERRVYLIERQ